MLFTAAFNVGMGSLTWTVATEMLPVRDESTLSRLERTRYSLPPTRSSTNLSKK